MNETNQTIAIFTENWNHLPWSPAMLGDRDVHSDRFKMLVVPAQRERPAHEVPIHISDNERFIDLLGAKDANGEVGLVALMIRLRQASLYEKGEDRIVMVDDVPFDAWQIWCICIAILGCAESVAWHLQKCDVGANLYLIGANWRAIIRSCSDGTGPQILP